MDNTDNARGGEDETEGLVRKASRLAVLAGLSVLAFALALVWLASLHGVTSPVQTAQRCVSIPEADVRLRCYDESMHVAAQPARGAAVPRSN